MSFGRGTSGDVGYGDADSWGGPANGIDVMEGIGEVSQAKTARVSKDTYTFIVTITALVLLWVMGGVIFGKVRL